MLSAVREKLNSPDTDEASRFIGALIKDDRAGDHYTFQTFDDSDAKRPELARVFHGKGNSETLAQLNASGAGVFLMVNAGTGGGRNEKSVKRVRAVFIDADRNGADVLAAVMVERLVPHITVESSPGKFHVYWLVRDCPLEKFTAVQAALASKFSTDPKVKDLPRVMRLPGFHHMKASPFMARIVECNERAAYTLDEIVEGLGLDLDGPTQAKPSALAVGSEAVQEGDRNSYLSRKAYALRKEGSSVKNIEAILTTINEERCNPPLDIAEIKAIARGKYKVAPESFASDFDMLALDEPTAVAEPKVHFPKPFPGPMADAVAAVLAGAPKPQPELATLGVVIAMASCCPGYYRLSNGTRLNLYGIGVAATGAGKDAPRTAAVAIARAGGVKLIGKPASGQGLEDAVEPFIGMLSEIDEIAHLIAAMNGTGVPAYLIELASNLLRLFTSSNGTYTTRQRASAKGVMPSRSIEHPCVSVLGFATPEKLGEAMGVSNIEDGLAGRMLFAFGRSDVTPRRGRNRFSVPASVTATTDLIRATIGATDFGLDPFIEIQVAPDADTVLDALLVTLDSAATGAGSSFARALQMRSFEKLERIAGVLAVWGNPTAPIVEMQHVLWAEQMIAASDNAALRFCGEYLHGGQVQADAARVLRAARAIQRGEIKPDRTGDVDRLKGGHISRSLVLRASKLDKRRFDDAVAHLVALEDLKPASVEKEQANGKRVSTQIFTLQKTT